MNYYRLDASVLGLSSQGMYTTPRRIGRCERASKEQRSGKRASGRLLNNSLLHVIASEAPFCGAKRSNPTLDFKSGNDRIARLPGSVPIGGSKGRTSALLASSRSDPVGAMTDKTFLSMLLVFQPLKHSERELKRLHGYSLVAET